MWSLTTAFLVFALQAPAAAPADPIAEGRKALESGDYAAAERCFAQAVQADPKDYASLFHLALAQTGLHKDAEAVAGYKKVLELKPNLYQAELNLGLLLLQNKQPKDAIPYLEQAAAQKPAESRPRLYLADALFDAGDMTGAEESYKQAAAQDPNSGAAELGLARIALRQGRLPDAEPRFRRAVELDGKLKTSLLELGEACERAGRAADAIGIYQQFPDNPGAQEHLGQLLLQAGRAADAVPPLETAVAKSPTPANRVALARAYLKTNQADKGLELLAQTVEADPGNLDLRMAYGRELRDQRRFAQAAEQFSRIVQAKPDSVEGWNELAGMLISLENFPQALAALDKARALGGERPGHLFFRAIVLERLGDKKGALESYRQFLAQSQGKYPNEEFKAEQRARILGRELGRR